MPKIVVRSTGTSCEESVMARVVIWNPVSNSFCMIEERGPSMAASIASGSVKIVPNPHKIPEVEIVAQHVKVDLPANKIVVSPESEWPENWYQEEE